MNNIEALCHECRTPITIASGQEAICRDCGGNPTNHHQEILTSNGCRLVVEKKTEVTPFGHPIDVTQITAVINAPERVRVQVLAGQRWLEAAFLGPKGGTQYRLPVYTVAELRRLANSLLDVVAVLDKA